MNIDIIDSTEEAGNSGDTSISKIKNRICGLFDAEPSGLEIRNVLLLLIIQAGTKHNFAIARMPRSPIVPVIFDINE